MAMLHKQPRRAKDGTWGHNRPRHDQRRSSLPVQCYRNLSARLTSGLSHSRSRETGAPLSHPLVNSEQLCRAAGTFTQEQAMPKAPPKVSAPRPKRKAWTGNNASKRLLKGRALQRERERLFAAAPLCQECKRNGRTALATIRDHVIPLAQGGKDERENTQGLCGPCHDAKSRQEAAEGARRVRSGSGP